MRDDYVYVKEFTNVILSLCFDHLILYTQAFIWFGCYFVGSASIRGPSQSRSPEKVAEHQMRCAPPRLSYESPPAHHHHHHHLRIVDQVSGSSTCLTCPKPFPASDRCSRSSDDEDLTVLAERNTIVHLDGRHPTASLRLLCGHYAPTCAHPREPGGLALASSALSHCLRSPAS